TKNFSFILKKDEKWTLSPAYDICFAFDETNHWVSKQTLSINGKRQGILKSDLMTIAKANNIKKGEQIVNEINAVIKSWSSYAKIAGVRKDLDSKIQSNLNTF